jgi:hypothetical protein
MPIFVKYVKLPKESSLPSGYLDPIKVLWHGNPASISAEVGPIMRICKKGGGFIFITGEMVPQETSLENMDA